MFTYSFIGGDYTLAIVNVNSKALREYLQSLHKWLMVFDEVNDCYNDIYKRVKVERDKVNSKNDSIILKKNQCYMDSLRRQSEFHSSIKGFHYDDNIIRTLNSLQNNVNICKRDLEESENTKSNINRLFFDFEELYRKNESTIHMLETQIDDLVKKSVLNLGEFADITDISNENVNNIGYVITGTSQVNGIVCRNLTAAVNASQSEFITSAISQCLTKGYRPSKCYKDDIRHAEIDGLDITCQTWQTQGEYSVFNTPEKTGEKLDSNQGKLNTFLGTCGCVSCVNVLKLAGIDISEEELVTYAATHENENGESLCSYGSSDYAANGGTTVMDRKNILEAYGVKSKFVFPSIENIFKEVSQGKGVIASVHASFLYDGKISDDDRHAVTITSVKYKNNKPYSVIVCDSNNRPSAEYVVDVFKTALTGNFLNVTEKIIR